MTIDYNVSIPASDFFSLVAEPSIEEFFQDSKNIRKIVMAIWAVSALIEHICWENFPDYMHTDGDKFLRNLASKQPAYAVIREASNCLKHAVRNRGTPKAAGSASVNVRPRGWGEAEFGVDEWGGTTIALVDFIDGRSVSIKHALHTLEPWIQAQLKKPNSNS
jgi:hypothetical protein